MIFKIKNKTYLSMSTRESERVIEKKLQLRVFEDRQLVSDKTVLCRSVPMKKWIGKKSLNPWAFFRLFEECEKSRGESPCIYECCICFGTFYVSNKNYVDGGRTRLVQHLKEVHDFGSFRGFLDGGKGTEDQVKTGRVNSSDSEKREFVLRILESGLPYSQFVESKYPLYRYLKSLNLPIVSSKTFRKYAVFMSLEALDAIFAAMKGCFVFISMDSTPGKDRRTFITRRFSFVNKDGDFQNLNFGVLNVEGVLDKKQYEEHIIRFLRTFNIDNFDWNTQTDNKSKSLGAFRENPVFIGGVADLGPGAVQALQSFSGKIRLNLNDDLNEQYASPIGCDAAHGQNNILKAAVENTPLLTALCDHARAICNEIRKTYNLKVTLNAPVPPKFRTIRWGASVAVIRYVYENLNELYLLESPNLKEALDFYQRKRGTVTVLREIFNILDSSQKILQKTGAFDALFLPFHVAVVLKDLYKFKASLSHRNIQLDDLESLQRFANFLIIRFHRRFFYNELVFDNHIYTAPRTSDTTRKFNFFNNIFVLLAFAISPYSQLKTFIRWGLMSSEKASQIHSRCEAALKSVFRLLWNRKVSVLNPPQVNHDGAVNNDGAVFDDDIQSESSRPLSEDGQTFEHSYLEFHKEIERFRGCEEVKTLLQVTMKDGLKVPFFGAHHDVDVHQATRAKFLKACWKHSEPSEEFRKLVMIVSGFTFSTVECESDFSWLQHLLGDKKTSMSSKMVAASLLAKQCLSFFKIEGTLPKLPVNVSDSEAGESNQEVY